VPDKNEVLILSNRRILADQIDFLLARLPEKSRLRKWEKGALWRSKLQDRQGAV
jgi:intein/homing endonuclease